MIALVKPIYRHSGGEDKVMIRMDSENEEDEEEEAARAT